MNLSTIFVTQNIILIFPIISLPPILSHTNKTNSKNFYFENNKMTKITLIRHGITEEKKGNQSDFLRALTVDGRIEFLERLHRHSNELQDIDMIICSPATRCSQTCHLLCSIIDIDPDLIIYDNRIYTFENSYDTLLEVLQSVP